MLHRKISVLVAIGLVLGLVGAAPAAAATPQGEALPISDANLKALTSTMGGAQALPTSDSLFLADDFLPPAGSGIRRR